MLLCVNYHYIRPSFPAQGIHGVTPAQFRAQLEELAKIGTFVSGEQVRSGKLPERAILITYDDGLAEQFTYEPYVRTLFLINTQPILTRTVLRVHKLHLLLAAGWEGESWMGPSDEASAKYPYDTPKMAAIKYAVNVNRAFDISDIFREWFDEAEVSQRLYMTREQIAQLPHVGVHGHGHGCPETGYGIAAQYLALWRGGAQPYAVSYPFGHRAACIPPLGFELGFTMERGINADLSRPLLLGRISCADLPKDGNYEALWELPRCEWS